MKKGQSLFEVVLAIFIMTLIITAIVVLSTNSIGSANYSKNKTQASKYSQEAIEWLRSEREKDIDLFLGYAVGNPTYCLKFLDFTRVRSCSLINNDDNIPSTIFKRELKLITTTQSSKTIINAEINTFWSDSKGLHEVKTFTDLNDIRQK